jgi:ribosomal protein S18 acetylase RimI-like enzyme
MQPAQLSLNGTSSAKVLDRVIVHEARGQSSGPLQFKRVDIKYSNGTLFYSGWIQDFGDARTGPTFFEQNYNNFNLEREEVIRREVYWQQVSCNATEAGIRDATPTDLDSLIDLTFQNYFDGGHNRISSFQGLNHKIDDAHITLVFTVGDTIFGYLYIDLEARADRGEAYFDSLYCAPAVRNKGVGRALLAAGLTRVRQAGFRKVSGDIIGSEAHCERIAKMLDSHGFEVVECRQMQGWLEVDMLKTF